ncbi:MAG: alpha/beta hydrolase [Ruminococcus sp.]|nr:alpha/beta hydrolase [Ruminococcus sp.]
MLNAATRQFEFKSEFDGLSVSAFIAKPQGNINGIVQLVHGMNEHKERYFEFMDYLASEGFITVIHDNRGHGHSIAADEDLGFMYRNGGEGFISDMIQLRKSVRSAYPNSPYFMIGDDIGALALKCMLKEHDDGLNGVILLSSPSYSRFSRYIRNISAEVSQKRGSRYISDLIYDVREDSFNKEFGSVRFSWRNSRKEAVEEFAADPLCNFRYTLNGYQCILHIMREAYDKNGWNVTNPKLPIRCLSGRDDAAMLSERKFMKSVNLLDKAGYESVSFRLFDGMRHELLHEKNCANVYKDIAKTLYSWLDRINDFRKDTEISSAPEQEAVELLGVPDTFTPVTEQSTQDTAPEPVHTSEADVFEILESVRAAEEAAAAKDTEQKG